MKQCSKCNQIKPYDEFHKTKKHRDGLSYNCKQCVKEYVKQWSVDNPDLDKQIHKASYKKYRTKRIKQALKLQSSLGSGIYMITCLVNNKRYVGKSKKLYRRKSQHLSILKDELLYITSIELQYDLRKYGRENFTFEILEQCSLDLLNERENYYIKLLNPEYNIGLVIQ